MTSLCPDWAVLAREREQAERRPEIGDANVDALWQDALRHREGCDRCRAASLDVDPLLLFSGAFAGGEDEDDRAGEVDAIRRRVRLELDGRATERRLNEARSARRRLPMASLLAAGVAAAALGASLLLWRANAPSPAEVAAAGAPGANPPIGLEDAPATLAIADAALALPDHIAMAPLVEPLGDEPLQVYQVPGNGNGADLDVVLVVAP